MSGQLGVQKPLDAPDPVFGGRRGRAGWPGRELARESPHVRPFAFASEVSGLLCCFAEVGEAVLGEEGGDYHVAVFLKRC